MRPPMLPIPDTTDRYRRYKNALAAPKVPLWHLRHQTFFLLLNRHTSLLLNCATGVPSRNTVALPPPGALPDFRETQRGFAHHARARGQVVQVLLHPEQVRVR